MLDALGAAPGASPELWNVERPEAILEIHKEYAEAGADLIQTNTFGGNRRKLAAFGLEARMGELNEAGVALAREAAGDEIAVLGDVGPTGALLEPHGTMAFDEAVEVFAEQIAILASAGVDGLILETFVALEEATAAVEAARQNTDLPVVCTMAFDRGGVTVMGVTGEMALAALVDAGADVVGANCGSGPEDVLLAIESMRKADPEVPLMAQPNAGVPKLVGSATVFDGTPGELAGYARRFIEAGVSIVGSCCGSTPRHTAAIAEAVKDVRKREGT